MAKSLTAQDIHTKYYANIPAQYFVQIIDADTLTSNLARGKVGMYAKWFLRLYQKNRLFLNELETAKQYIAVFDRMSKANMLENKDINHYNSLQDLYLVVQPYLNAKIISKSEHTKTVKNSEAEKLYEDEQFLVVYPKTKWAASTYGKHTKWCTATSKYITNYFEKYSKDGKLYIIIDKKNNLKFQFHFDTNTYCDSEDKTVAINSLNSIKRLTPTKGLIDFFIEERQNKYLWEDTPDKLNIGENVDKASNSTIYIGIHKKKYGLMHGSKGWNILIPFEYDLIKKQEFLPDFYETYKNGETDLCSFANNTLFYQYYWYSESKKKFVECNMYKSNDLLFPYFFPICKGDLNGIVKILVKRFNQKYFTSVGQISDFKKKKGKYIKRQKNNNHFIPNSISANALMMSILEYAYYGNSSSNEDYSAVIAKCRKRIAEFGKNEIPKIITRLAINDLDLFWVIDSKIPDGVFRLQYSEMLDVEKIIKNS